MIIYIIISAFFSQKVHAQTVDKNYINSINLFIQYMNKTVDGLTETYFIFSDSYFWIQGGDDIGVTFRQHSFIGTPVTKYSDDAQYAQVNMLRNRLDQGHSKLFEVTDSVHLIYNNLIELSYEVRNHILSRKYEYDNFASYNVIIEDAQRLYKIYYKLMVTFRSEIQIIAEKVLASEPDNQNRVMEMNMRNALDYQLPLLYEWTFWMNEVSYPYEAMKMNAAFTDKEYLHYEKTPDIHPKVRFHYKRFYSYLKYEHQKIKKNYLKYDDTESLMQDPDYLEWHLISAFNIRCAREHDMYVKEAEKAGIYMLNYVRFPYLFILESVSAEDIVINEPDISTEDKNSDISYNSMDGYAVNHLVLLLDVSGSMNSEDKLPLLKSSFIRLLKILRKEDLVSIVIFSGKGELVLNPTSGADKQKVIDVLDNLKSKGSTNISSGLELAFSTAAKDFVTEGNNRIILATDGQFEIDKALYKLTKQYSKKDIHLSVFHFGKKQNDQNLMKLASSGKGNYEIISKDNVALKLIKEAKAVKLTK